MTRLRRIPGARGRMAAVALAVIGCALAWVREGRDHPKLQARTFVVPPARTNAAMAPFFQTGFVAAAGHTPMSHVASICETADGRLHVVWYGGSREAASDVKLYLASRARGVASSWSEPRAIASPESAQQELQRPIQKVGNGVLFTGVEGELHFLYTSMPFGGWSCCSLNLKTSRDGGETWSCSQRLTLSPLLNFSQLVKNKPALMSEGWWAVPIYHELLASYPEVLLLQPSTKPGEARWTKQRVHGGSTSLQPALAALDATEAVMLLRDATPAKRIHTFRSTDAGQSWGDLELSALPNPNSGLDTVRLADGRLLLAFNDRRKGRSDLTLAVSRDRGRTWDRRAVLEQEAGMEFSYPSLIQAADGVVHLVYTWKKNRIKHAAFNAAWLDAPERN